MGNSKFNQGTVQGRPGLIDRNIAKGTTDLRVEFSLPKKLV